jgi:hypothetical protein
LTLKPGSLNEFGHPSFICFLLALDELPIMTCDNAVTKPHIGGVLSFSQQLKFRGAFSVEPHAHEIVQYCHDLARSECVETQAVLAAFLTDYIRSHVAGYTIKDAVNPDGVACFVCNLSGRSDLFAVEVDAGCIDVDDRSDEAHEGHGPHVEVGYYAHLFYRLWLMI